MSQIKSFKFDKNNFNEIRGYRFGKNWPVVYVLENGKDVYVGQAINAHRRLKQHHENPEKQILKLKTAHILSDEEFNVSAALDVESWLIQYMSADQVFTLHNKKEEKIMTTIQNLLHRHLIQDMSIAGKIIIFLIWIAAIASPWLLKMDIPFLRQFGL